jgi:hypothetical protein
MRTVRKDECVAVGEWGPHEVAVLGEKVFRIRQCPNPQVVTLLDELRGVRPDEVRRQLRPLRSGEDKLPQWKRLVNEQHRLIGLPKLFR